MNLRSISGDSHLLALAILFLFLFFWSLKIHKYSRIVQNSFEPNRFAAAIINTLSADVGGASAESGAPRCSPVYCLLSQLAAFGSQAAALQLIFPLLAAISFTLPRATATCNLQMFRLTLLCFLLTGNGNRQGRNGRSSSWSRRRRRSWLPVATSAAHVACATRNGLQWAGRGSALAADLASGIWICFVESLVSRLGSVSFPVSPAPSAALLLFIDALLCAIFVWQAAAASSSAGRWRCPSLAVGVRSTHESLFLRSLWRAKNT